MIKKFGLPSKTICSSQWEKEGSTGKESPSVSPELKNRSAKGDLNAFPIKTDDGPRELMKLLDIYDNRSSFNGVRCSKFWKENSEFRIQIVWKSCAADISFIWTLESATKDGQSKRICSYTERWISTDTNGKTFVNHLKDAHNCSLRTVFMGHYYPLNLEWRKE